MADQAETIANIRTTMADQAETITALQAEVASLKPAPKHSKSRGKIKKNYKLVSDLSHYPLNKFKYQCKNIYINSVDNVTNVIGFTAYATDTIVFLNPPETVIFDGVVSNYGDAYDSMTGVFTCPVTGYDRKHFVNCTDL